MSLVQLIDGVSDKNETFDYIGARGTTLKCFRDPVSFELAITSSLLPRLVEFWMVCFWRYRSKKITERGWKLPGPGSGPGRFPCRRRLRGSATRD